MSALPKESMTIDSPSVTLGPWAVAALAKELAVPVQQVQEVYQKELDELAAQARVRIYLDILALRSTRAILRKRAQRPPGGRS